MAEATAKRDLHTPNYKNKRRSNSQSSPSLPPTPLSATPRRSTRRTSLHFDDALPPPSPPATTLIQDPTPNQRKKIPKSIARSISTPQKAIEDGKSGRKEKESNQLERKEEKLSAVEFSPASPEPLERKKRKRGQEKKKKKKQVFYKKVVYDGGEFEVGDDVYVKRRDDDDEALFCDLYSKYSRLTHTHTHTHIYIYIGRIDESFPN